MKATLEARRFSARGLRQGAAAAGSMVLIAAIAIYPAAAAVSHQQIQGDGSTWAYNAVNQWISDVQQNGLQVVFTGVGSAQGRTDFANATEDFAVSDIGYQGRDPITGEADASSRPYAYVPIVAGGTAFPYQIRVAGQLVRNLRLSGETIAKIFANVITNWNDPQITADNNGRALPSIPIIPVVHSEGAGSTAQFTQYLNAVYPSIWKAYSGYQSFTEYYPRKGNQIAQAGSDGVINFVTSAAANGAIGYDEYSYAKAHNYPVAKVENTAGYFTAPDQYNVAVALTQAHINTDKSSPNYLLQDLSQVYVYNDPRTYPLSSYSYGIIPTSGNDPRLNTAKAQTLADYLFYSTCQGQAEMGPIGYSPLPINLVEASFQQVDILGQAFPGVNLANENVENCNNPTFVAGHPEINELAQIAPQPPPCDKAGAGPCDPNAGIYNGNPVGGQPAAGPGSTGSGPGAAASAHTGAAVSSGGASSGPSTGAAGGNGASLSDESADSNSTEDTAVLGTPTVIGTTGAWTAVMTTLAVIAVLVLVAVLTGPPFLSRRFGRRRKDGDAA
jgi:phosphate transport system substrate-binding protein